MSTMANTSMAESSIGADALLPATLCVGICSLVRPYSISQLLRTSAVTSDFSRVLAATILPMMVTAFRNSMHGLSHRVAARGALPSAPRNVNDGVCASAELQNSGTAGDFRPWSISVRPPDEI